MGERVREHCQRISVNVHHAEQQIHKRDNKKDQPGQCKKEMSGRIEVAKPLGKGESRSEQRIFSAQDLDHSTCPTDTLSNVRSQALRC